MKNKLDYKDFDEEKLEKLRVELEKLTSQGKVDWFVGKYIYDLGQYLRAVVEKLEDLEK